MVACRNENVQKTYQNNLNHPYLFAFNHSNYVVKTEIFERTAVR